jgi:hypothetical protein
MEPSGRADLNYDRVQGSQYGVQSRFVVFVLRSQIVNYCSHVRQHILNCHLGSVCTSLYLYTLCVTSSTAVRGQYSVPPPHPLIWSQRHLHSPLFHAGPSANFIFNRREMNGNWEVGTWWIQVAGSALGSFSWSSRNRVKLSGLFRF